MSAREGWLIAIESGGLRGYGDCAPLPEAGTETLATAGLALADWRGLLQGSPLAQALGSLDCVARIAPAAAYALECALLDLDSRMQGLSLRRLLSGRACESVPVNGALGPLAELATADLARAAADGFLVLKVKVGVTDPSVELERLRALARALPAGVTLRLDANGAWDRASATDIVSALAGLPIECIEEPLALPDPAALAELQTLAGFPLALDESLPGLLAQGQDPARLPVRRAIVKPAVQGGLRRSLDLARRFQSAGIEVVVTSLVESAAGLWPTAQLAGAIGSRVPQGLATADWLVRDLGHPPRPWRGTLHLPERPGSGFEPCEPILSGL